MTSPYLSHPLRSQSEARAEIDAREERARIIALARAMPLSEAAEILTLAYEPELLLDPGDVAPDIPADRLAAAELVSKWHAADLFPHAVN